MDELNKLKKMWDTSFVQQEKDLDQERVLGIIRSQSRGPVDKLKRSLYLELGTAILVVPFLIWVMFKLPEPYFLFNTSALLLLFVAAFTYYFYNLRKVTVFWNQNQENLRQSIEGTLVLFRFFRKTYFYLNMLLFPLGVYFGYIIGFGLGSGGKRVTSILLLQNMPSYLNVLLWIGLIIGAFVLFFIVLRFYVKKLYDVHINKLELIHKELTENDNQ
jgi:hypothetical protein